MKVVSLGLVLVLGCFCVLEATVLRKGITINKQVSIGIGGGGGYPGGGYGGHPGGGYGGGFGKGIGGGVGHGGYAQQPHFVNPGYGGGNGGGRGGGFGGGEILFHVCHMSFEMFVK
ncbi:unnamed protein product [Callosobruchus maculatus]|uniref:Uncharacterized protein n=1 Tax=Callosobruchus maculatus TaxID=64391 RepID=A0A653C0R1_CALMS|nr:unnamed protein product [Callosobruchus maculatus]